MKYLKVYVYVMLAIILGTLILGGLSYINILSENLNEIFKSLIVFLGCFLGGYVLGNKTNKKGFLEGIKIGGMFATTFLVMGFILFQKFRFQKLILALIIFLTSILGSILGINRKDKKAK